MAKKPPEMRIQYQFQPVTRSFDPYYHWAKGFIMMITLEQL